MTKEDILHFLRHGQLAHLKMGMSLKEVENLLGPNPGWKVPISRKDKRPSLIKYDRMEFYFGHEELQPLYGIQITYSQPASAQKLQVNYRKLINAPGRNELKDFLHSNKIPFQEITSPYDPSDQIFALESDILFFFDEEGKLQKFGRFLQA